MKVLCSIHNVVAASVSVSLLGERRVFNPQCCCLYIFVKSERAYWIYEGRVFHLLSSVSLSGEGETEYMKVLCSINTSLYFSGPVFDPRSTQLALYNSTSNHVGGKEAISVHSNYLNILDVGERFCIFVGKTWDCIRRNIWSTLNAASTFIILHFHNSTSNHVGGKEAICVNSNYLNILDLCLFFFNLCFTSSSICAIFVLKSWLYRIPTTIDIVYG